MVELLTCMALYIQDMHSNTCTHTHTHTHTHTQCVQLFQVGSHLQHSVQLSKTVCVM